jgi:hypothetical protein
MRHGVETAKPTRRAVLIGATALIAAAGTPAWPQPSGTLRPIGAGFFLDAFGAITTMPAAARLAQGR